MNTNTCAKLALFGVYFLTLIIRVLNEISENKKFEELSLLNIDMQRSGCINSSRSSSDDNKILIIKNEVLNN